MRKICLKVVLIVLASTFLIFGCRKAPKDDGPRFGTEIRTDSDSRTEVAPVTEEKESFRIMTYNVLLDPEKAGRKPDFAIRMAETIRKQDPDVFGTQENTTFIHDESISKAEGYSCYKGAALTDSNYRGNYVYWKTDKFTELEKGFRFMSDTPDVKSKYDGSKEYRGFTYVFLEAKETGTRFLFICLHADYRSDEETRVKQLKVVTAFLKAEKWKDVPAIIVGDFNSTSAQASITTFLADNPGIGMTSSIAERKSDTGGTLVGGGFTTRQNYVFDYIFVTKDRIGTSYYSVVENFTNGKAPSDHLPVIAEIEIG